MLAVLNRLVHVDQSVHALLAERKTAANLFELDQGAPSSASTTTSAPGATSARSRETTTRSPGSRPVRISAVIPVTQAHRHLTARKHEIVADEQNAASLHQRGCGNAKHILLYLEKHFDVRRGAREQLCIQFAVIQILCLLFIHPGAPNLISLRSAGTMPCLISSFVRALISAFKARRELALDNVALRQQLAVLRRSVKRPRLSNVDRGFWVTVEPKGPLAQSLSC